MLSVAAFKAFGIWKLVFAISLLVLCLIHLLLSQVPGPSVLTGHLRALSLFFHDALGN